MQWAKYIYIQINTYTKTLLYNMYYNEKVYIYITGISLFRLCQEQIVEYKHNLNTTTSVQVIFVPICIQLL